MDTFRQWHEGTETELKFHNESRLYFCQCDARHKLSLFELLRLATDTAVEDYRQRGMSWQFLAERGIAILVSRQSFRFHRLPEANARITISTWEEAPQPLQLMRTYEITDTDSGERLVSGRAAWMVVDVQSRRIVRAKDFTLRAPPTISTDHDCLPPGKITVPERMAPLAERPICYSDIDGNGHMNNARYGAFVMDCLPPEYRQKDFTDFRINYSKEAVCGGQLTLSGAFDDEGRKIVLSGTQDGATCFEAELFY
ncbi:MAG: acyl-[acyl-carrier-protein] thioesterase [Treponemataceae bacterium]|nr:acyl-[acyl-carrier-protein] thioesterase [Treponemataceae bacterium]